jgi:hypothetical protein
MLPKGDIDGAIAAVDAKIANRERLNLAQIARDLGLREVRFLAESLGNPGHGRNIYIPLLRRLTPYQRLGEGSN